jgi:hypothetical protein
MMNASEEIGSVGWQSSSFRVHLAPIFLYFGPTPFWINSLLHYIALAATGE